MNLCEMRINVHWKMYIGRSSFYCHWHHAIDAIIDPLCIYYWSGNPKTKCWICQCWLQARLVVCSCHSSKHLPWTNSRRGHITSIMGRVSQHKGPVCWNAVSPFLIWDFIMKESPCAAVLVTPRYCWAQGTEWDFIFTPFDEFNSS